MSLKLTAILTQIQISSDDASGEELSDYDFLEEYEGEEEEEDKTLSHKFVMVGWGKLHILFEFCCICGNAAELVNVVNKHIARSDTSIYIYSVTNNSLYT